jgi:hypothetical protein
MPDQAAVLAIVAPPTVSGCTGPGLDTDAGGRVIPLDSRRRRPSPEVVKASRACHPAQLWADDLRAASPS